MKYRRCQIIVSVFFMAAAASHAVADLQNTASKESVESCARQALDAMLGARIGGGWGMAWTHDQSLVWGEHMPIPEGWITVQPPATPGVATVLLRAARVLDDATYLKAAQEARDALLALQSDEGGLPHEGKPGAVRKDASFDDNTTTGALDFFIALWQHTNAPEDRAVVDSVGEFILTAQYPDSGGWPQNYPPRSGSYHEHITFNDGNFSNIIRALLRLHELTGDDRYRDAAKRGGECILKLQGGPGESIWAQQYDHETLLPAPARAFEPAGYSAGESAAVCSTLIELYLEFEDPRYLDAIDRALEWYDTHRLPNGKFSRLYEPDTQRPVYGLAEKPFITYEVSEARPGYSWQAEWYPGHAKADLTIIREEGVEALRALRNRPAKAKSAAEYVEPAEQACAAVSADGFWLDHPSATERDVLGKRKLDPDQPMVRTRTFCKNMTILLDYIEAAAGETPPQSGEPKSS